MRACDASQVLDALTEAACEHIQVGASARSPVLHKRLGSERLNVRSKERKVYCKAAMPLGDSLH